jgi:hypothetical protein
MGITSMLADTDVSDKLRTVICYRLADYIALFMSSLHIQIAVGGDG